MVSIFQYFWIFVPALCGLPHCHTAVYETCLFCIFAQKDYMLKYFGMIQMSSLILIPGMVEKLLRNVRTYFSYHKHNVMWLGYNVQDMCDLSPPQKKGKQTPGVWGHLPSHVINPALLDWDTHLFTSQSVKTSTFLSAGLSACSQLIPPQKHKIFNCVNNIYKHFSVVVLVKLCRFI